MVRRLESSRTTARGGRPGNAARGTIRVLLVEDDPSDALLTTEALAGLLEPGFDVLHLLHLRGALEALGAGASDVVLADLSLPDAQGLEACRRILDAHPDVPLVVLTGLEDEELGLQAVHLGAQDYLVKTRLVPEMLRRSLHYAIQRHELLADLAAAAREARAGEARLRSLIARSAEGLLVVDASDRILFANPAAEGLFGRRGGELMGSTFALAATVPGGPREVAVPRADGTSVPAEMRASELEWQGGPATLVSLYDLSGRKRAERIALAQNVQRAFLPERHESRAGVLELAGVNELCEDASGDYYDFVDLGDGCILVAAGDVTGHGLGPALVMAQARAFLRAFSRDARDLSALASRMNDALAADMAHGRFMSLFLARVDVRTGAATWCNAGHVPGFLLRTGTGAIERLEATGLVLGVLPGLSYGAGRPLTLGPGDTLLLCSDGATEAAEPGGGRFGDERLADALARHAGAPAPRLLDGLLADLGAFRAERPLEDDLTLVAVRRRAEPGPPSPAAAPSRVA